MTLSKEPHLIKWVKVTLRRALVHAKTREILTETKGWVNNTRQGDIIEFTDGTYLGCYSDWDAESDARFGCAIIIEMPCHFYIGA